MPRLEPEVAPPAVTFIMSLIATVGAMLLTFGLPGSGPSDGLDGSFSQSGLGYFWAIGLVALPLLIMLGSFFWLTIAIVHRSRPAR